MNALYRVVQLSCNLYIIIMTSNCIYVATIPEKLMPVSSERRACKES